MTPFDIRQVKDAAKQALTATETNHKKLVLLHTGAMLLLSLALMVIDLLLDQKISATGGLSGIGARSTLTTIQSILRIAELAVVPFWQVGYTYLTLRISQKEPANASTLTEGFFRFRPVLRLYLLQILLYVLIAIVSTNICSMLFIYTPWADQLFAVADQMQQGVEFTNETLLAATGDALIPLMIGFFGIYLAFCIPIFYSYRLAMLHLLDDETSGAWAAMRQSRLMTKGHRLQLFKLDLSFWWYYLLELLVGAICFADLILEAFGITLPLPPAAMTFIVFGLYAIALLGLHYWRKNEVNVTYAQVYNTLMEE
jgi:uncharacterized membrane protein